MHVRWRGLELPSQVNVERSTLSATYGKFTAEPFERGFGATIGNSLRRVLLSSLEGSAITQIKIRGAQHEFSSIPNILEDVTEIVLNVKSLVVKNHSDNTRVLTVVRSKAGPIFSPVVRVRYTVEETRVGQKTNYDRLVIEIWTDGSLQPELAMVEGAKILRKHLNPFVQSGELGRQVHAVARGGPGSAEAQLESKLNTLVSDLKLSVRANNCLESEGIRYVRDLVQRTEDQLLEVRNFGETTLTEVREKLSILGLHLGMRVPSSMR